MLKWQTTYILVACNILGWPSKAHAWGNTGFALCRFINCVLVIYVSLQQFMLGKEKRCGFYHFSNGAAHTQKCVYQQDTQIWIYLWLANIDWQAFWLISIKSDSNRKPGDFIAIICVRLIMREILSVVCELVKIQTELLQGQELCHSMCLHCKRNVYFPCWVFWPVSLSPTVASGHHTGGNHYGGTGVMRERRTVDDPYWSYSGELSFMLWLEPK